MITIKAMAVDDEKFNLLIFEDLARSAGIDIVCFERPLEALEYAQAEPIDLALVDYMMPKMDGIEFIRELKKHHRDIPIVMVTAVAGNVELKLSALDAGATEFLIKPIEAPDFIARIKNLGELRKAQLMLKDRALLLEDEVARATELVVNRELETLQVLGKAADYRDSETGSHIIRVSHYSRFIAMRMGESEEVQDLIFYASPLHDVGKIGISDNILLKPDRLTDEEFIQMKKHVIIGHDILKNASSKYLQAGAIIALTHHEKFSGDGYPYGLEGENIHVYGRIVAVSDVFDALTMERPYKQPWPFEKAVKLIQNERGKHFDPEAADAFLSDLDEIHRIFTEYVD